MNRKIVWLMTCFLFMVISITGCGREKEVIVEVTYDKNSNSLLGDGITYQIAGKSATVTGYWNLEIEIENLRIPDQICYEEKNYPVTKIAEGAFESDVSLVSFTAGANISSIGESAFYACDALEFADLADCVKKLGKDAFGGCTSLSELKGLKKLKSIADDAFESCSSMTDIALPKSVESMGTGIFTDCTALKRCVLEEGITVLGEGMFTNCSALSEVTFPESLVSIGAEAFWGCYELSDLTLPEKLITIGERAFYDTGIKSLRLPDSVSGVRFEMLDGMGELERIEVPSGKKEFYSEQFRDYGIEIVTY